MALKLVNLKWIDDDTIKLIKLYTQFPCLWNPEHKDYRYLSKRKLAHEYIVRKMNKPNFDLSELRQKIKNLRCTYHQERVKVVKSRESGCREENVYVPTLKWYSLMDNILSRRGGSEDSRAMNSTCDEEIKLQGEPLEESIDFDFKSEPSSTSGGEAMTFKTEPMAMEEYPPIEDPLLNQDYQDYPASPPRKKASKSNTLLMVPNDNIISNSASGGIEGNNEPANSAFGSYVAYMLDKMPFEQSILAQSEIQSILVRYLVSSAQAQSDDVYMGRQ